ncbi:MAG: hypothetical protein R6V10_16555 [bacterium]
MSARFGDETWKGRPTLFSTGWSPPGGEGYGPPEQQYNIGENYPMPGGGPPQQQKSSGWKFVLLGCGCLAVLVVVALVGGFAYFYKKGPDFIGDMYEMGKPQFMTLLTDEHTEEQKENFEDALDTFIRDCRSDKYDNLMDWAEKGPREIFQKFQTIQQDGKITVEESREWAAMVEEKLESGGPEDTKY